MAKSRPSTIDRLPEEIREKIAKLRDQGRTLQEILDLLDTLNVDVSRSALGRWVKDKERVAENIRRSREMAEAVSRTFGGAEASKVNRTNIEILHSLLMKLMVGDDASGEIKLDAKDAMFLATALEKMSKASKTDLDGQIKADVELERRKATEKAAGAAETEMQRQGLSAETVNKIKASILGVTA